MDQIKPLVEFVVNLIMWIAILLFGSLLYDICFNTRDALVPGWRIAIFLAILCAVILISNRIRKWAKIEPQVRILKRRR